jgi:hypothetical protein
MSAARKRLEVLSKATIGFLATFCLTCIICVLAQCIPLHKLWDFTGAIPGTCINTTALFYGTSHHPTLMSLTKPPSHKLSQHRNRHLDPRPSCDHITQSPTPHARESRSSRHL